jgi:hypothetical protein
LDSSEGELPDAARGLSDPEGMTYDDGEIGEMGDSDNLLVTMDSSSERHYDPVRAHPAAEIDRDGVSNVIREVVAFVVRARRLIELGRPGVRGELSPLCQTYRVSLPPAWSTILAPSAWNMMV